MTGEQLRHWREVRHIDIRDLARALSVDLATVYRWERGERRPPGMIDLALEALERRIEGGRDD